MISKKVCMVGVFGTGKTSLVQRFVQTKFSDRYLSTVGVKIDRKVVAVDGADITLVLWDLAGRDGHQEVNGSYLRGAHGVIYVGDGTRATTVDQLGELRRLGTESAGDVPSVTALNKIDLVDAWTVSRAEEAALAAQGGLFRTSAKSGVGVEEMFLHLTRALIAPGGSV